MILRRPVAFDGCFGFLRPGRLRRGVVLCPAFGLEGLTARRAWGDLADRLAAAGLPTLSFDWPGTGDSLGGDRDPERPAAWRAGLDTAIDTLLAETGVEEIAIVGLRLGATIAAEVARHRPEVTLFVAAAPVVSGRVFVREQKSLSRLLRVRGDDEPPDTDESDGWAVGGFFTSETTGATIAAIDLRKSEAMPAGDVVLLAREGDAAAQGLAEHWRGLGARVEEIVFDGLENFLTDPTNTRSPGTAWEAIVTRTADGAAPATSDARLPATSPAVVDGGAWHEEAHLFGPGDRLFGILSTPRRPIDGAPTVILLPGGRNPHVGWGRGTVELARRLAAQGRTVLRMDQAGIGDSRNHPDGPEEVLYSLAPIADVAAAMDRFGEAAAPFVVIGPCSGAHLALHTALADPRVVGVAMINLQRFVWRDGDSLEASMRGEFRSSNAYAGLARRADTWKRLFTGKIKVGPIAIELLRRISARVWAKLRRLVTTQPAVVWLRSLDRRGTRVLFVFGSADGGRDEFAENIGREGMLHAIAPRARVELVERTDHNLGPHDARRRLEGLIAAFLAEVDADPAVTSRRVAAARPSVRAPA